MICRNCRSHQCSTCSGLGVVEVQVTPDAGSPEIFPCGECDGRGYLPGEHEECIYRNQDKPRVDCDCQHRE